MVPIPPFSIARLPRIVFGPGTLLTVAAEASAFGRRALIVTGARSFRSGPHWPVVVDGLKATGFTLFDVAIEGEPSPEAVDGAVTQFRGEAIDVVVGVGGGSALDAAKAIAGLLPSGRSVLDHLEGVGPQLPYAGPALPLIAVPTTAGTGSEATKNAVLTRPGDQGFKRSFRDEALVARVAVVDPDLLATCPPEVIAANGMDAFTQLLESYTSIKSNPLTDALAWSGMAAFRDGFFAAWRGGSGADAAAGRSLVAYAALLSGICLAQTGLGAVHGLASPLGAHFPIPHGVCCGTLVAAATAVNVRALEERAETSPAGAKYARVGAMLASRSKQSQSDDIATLLSTLDVWTEALALPRLGAYGLTPAAVPQMVAESRGSSMKTNPIVLTDEEVAEIMIRRL
jgi:alcohol dehydrogenase